MHRLLVLCVMAACVLPTQASAQKALTDGQRAQTQVHTDQPEALSDTLKYAVPIDGGAATQALSSQLSDIDAQLGRLHTERRRLRLGGPITMMSFGVMTVAAGAVVGLAAASSTATSGDAVVHVFRPFGIAGSLLFVSGTIFLGVRVHKRRANGRLIQALREQRGKLEIQLYPTAPIAHGSPTGLLLSARF